MNLQTLIKAGGPGSGCKPGSGCGPTPKSTSTETIYPHSGKGSMGVGKPADRQQEERLGKITGPKTNNTGEFERKNAPPPIYQKDFDKAELEKQAKSIEDDTRWRKGLPSKQETVDPRIKDGVMVTTNTSFRAFNNNTLEFQNYKPGTTLFVEKVMPKIGNNPTMVRVFFPHGDDMRIPASEVKFKHDPDATKFQDLSILPQRKPNNSTQYQTNTGAKYTILPSQKVGRPEGSGNIYKKGQIDTSSHALKGQFEIAKGPRGNKMQ